MGERGSRTEELEDDMVDEEASETMEEIELVEVREADIVIVSCELGLHNLEPPLFDLLGEGPATAGAQQGSAKYSRLPVLPRSPSPSSDG